MSGPRRSAVPVVLAVAALTFLSYAPTLGFAYAQDAVPAVAANPVLERGSLREIFASDYWKDTSSPARTLYRPVTVTSFALERALFGTDPAASHGVNAALHALTALLLYALARRLGAGEAAAAACSLLFAAHPLLLQAVANVVGRSDILATAFALAALLCTVIPARDDRGGEASPGGVGALPRLAAWGAGVFAFGSMASKEVGLAVVPLVVLAVALYRGAPRGGNRWLAWAGRLGPTVIATLLYLHLRTVAIGEFPGLQPLAVEDNLLVGLSGVPYAATALGLIARYARLLGWPTGLSPDYSGGVIEPDSSLLAPLPLLGIVLLAGLAILVVMPVVAGLRARPVGPVARTTSMGAALFLFPYLLVGNLLVLNAAGFAERMIYFSATGFCLLVAVSVVTWLRALPPRMAVPARVAAVVLWLLVLAGGVVQIRRLSPMWRDNRALFDYTDRAAPRSLRAGLALAGRLEAEGRLGEAIERYERIQESAPGYGGSFMAHGVLLGRLGQLEEAERALRRSIELRPDVGEAHMNLGLLLVLRGRPADAERELRKALLYDPSLVKAAAQLGHLLFESGRYAEAAHFYEGCVRLGRADLRGRLAAARERAGAAPGS